MRTNSEGLVCHVDAGWAGDRGEGTGPRQSRSGVLITVNGLPKMWMSKRQEVIALSTAEAETYSRAETVK